MTRDVWAATRPAVMGELGLGVARSPLLDAKVMMVDDEPLMTDLVQTYLEEEGYANFVATHDPREALALLRRERPSLLLLDLMMPLVSGFDLLEAIRADKALRYTPVIVLTASTGADSKLRALRLGATDFLSKPVDASELVLRVRNTLAFRQYHERMTHFDSVTGLPRETLIEQAVDALIEQTPPGAGLLAWLSITIPECRSLREGLDRRLADELAVLMADRLQAFIQPGAATAAGASAGGGAGAARQRPANLRRTGVARLDEQSFVLVLEGLEGLPEVEQMAKRVLAALAEPAALGPHEVVAVPRIGVSTLPADGCTAAALRQSADLAASHAAARSGGNLAFASPELNAKSYERITLGAQLRGATARGELLLHYQPKVALPSGRIVGVEALLRWQHPARGLVPPGQFIPLAEELGLMGPIGDWVIQRACADLARLRREGHVGLTMAVNVSKPQITAGQLDAVVRAATEATGAPAGRLVIELTESLLMDDVGRCLELMQSLKSAGARLSIDDFGTGYSSLAYLKQFPLDELKIDRSFVKDLPGGPRDQALVGIIVELGHGLGMSVTAEGVETADQRDALIELDCDVAQGFLFSRPLTFEALQERLQLEAQAVDGQPPAGRLPGT